MCGLVWEVVQSWMAALELVQIDLYKSSTCFVSGREKRKKEENLFISSPSGCIYSSGPRLQERVTLTCNYCYFR